MVDKNQSFLLQMKEMKVENLGKLFYLRCFNQVPTKGSLKKIAPIELKVTPKSGALLIPDYFYDYKKFFNYLA